MTGLNAFLLKGHGNETLVLSFSISAHYRTHSQNMTAFKSVFVFQQIFKFENAISRLLFKEVYVLPIREKKTCRKNLVNTKWLPYLTNGGQAL